MGEILVTGGTGFLGRYVLDWFNSQEKKPTVLACDRAFGHPNIVVNLETLEGLPESLDFRSVYHLAGYAHRRPRTPEESQRFYKINSEGTKAILRSLEQSNNPPSCFVLVSTVAVYGEEVGELLPESTPRQAVDPYGESKRIAEDEVVAWGGRLGVRTTILRLPLIVGRGASGNLQLLLRTMRKGLYLGIGNGLARRSMVWAGDVAAILAKAGEVGGTFHLTDGQHPTVGEFEGGLARALGRTPPHRIPEWMAVGAGRCGDLVERLLGRQLPINSRSVSKLTSTLTFSDHSARMSLGWNPSPVLDHIDEAVRRA